MREYYIVGMIRGDKDISAIATCHSINEVKDIVTELLTKLCCDCIVIQVYSESKNNAKIRVSESGLIEL